MSSPVMHPDEFRAAVTAAARDAVRKYLEENPPGAAPAGPAAPTPIPRVHADAHAFYEDYFSPIFARDPGAQMIRWCSDAFAHAEFAEVMGVLWQSWEFLHVADPDMGMPVWYRDWAYPLLERLTNPEGTFAACTRKEGGHDEYVTIRPLAEATSAM